MQETLYNNNIERAVLSSILFDPVLFPSISSALSIDDFYLPFHKSVYTAMHILYTAEKPISDDFLKPQLLKTNSFDEIAFLELLSANPITNIDSYIGEIKEKANKRALIKLSQKIQKDISEYGTTHEIISNLQESILSIQENRTVSKIVTYRELMNKKYPPLIAYDTVEEGFNEACGGIYFPYLYLLNGERFAGKTTTLLKILMGFIHPVHFISLEMNDTLIHRKLTDLKIKPNSPFTFDFTSTDIEGIEASIWESSKKGVKLFAIDSLMKIRHKKMMKSTRMEQLNDIASRLYNLKNRLDITIILIVQSSKGKGQDGVLTVKGAGDVDYEADIILQITFSDSDDREITCTKNRAANIAKKAKLGTGTVETATKEKKDIDTHTQDNHMIKEDNEVIYYGDEDA